MQEHDPEWGQTVPVWAAFGDLMSGLVGAFVLLLRSEEHTSELQSH